MDNTLCRIAPNLMEISNRGTRMYFLLTLMTNGPKDDLSASIASRFGSARHMFRMSRLITSLMLSRLITSMMLNMTHLHRAFIRGQLACSELMVPVLNSCAVYSVQYSVQYTVQLYSVQYSVQYRTVPPAPWRRPGATEGGRRHHTACPALHTVLRGKALYYLPLFVVFEQSA